MSDQTKGPDARKPEHKSTVKSATIKVPHPARPTRHA